MGFFKRLFGGGDATGERAGTDAVAGQTDEPPVPTGPLADSDPSRHRVVCWVPLDDPAFEQAREQVRLFTLEDRLMRALYDSGAGDLDTNELGRGYLAIRFLGADADAMSAVLLPLLADAPRGTYLAVRRGPHGTAEDRIDVGPPAA